MMKKNWQDKEIWISAILSLLLLVVYSIAIHDKQIADGIGLYIAGKMGKNERAVFDLFSDGIRILIFLSIVLVPVLCKGKNVKSFFRLLSVYLAIMPIADAGFLVHLLYEGKESWVTAFSFNPDWNMTVSNGMELFRFLIFVLMFVLLLADKDNMKKILFNKKNTVLACTAMVSFILMMVFPGWKEILNWLFRFPLLLILFDLWETGKAAEPKRFGNIIAWCLFGLCFLRGIWRLLQIMSNAHL